MAAPFDNVYHLRRVAEEDSRPCAFCFKPTTCVLITSDGKSDFFYTCDVHLKDSAFASPVHDQAYLDAKAKKDALDKEITFLKQRWDEKNRYSSWEKIVSYTKWSSSKSETPKEDEDETTKNMTKEEREKADKKKLKELSTEVHEFDKVLSKPPRVYTLNKDIFRIRLSKKKKKQASPQPTDTTGVKDLSMFPSVPQKPLD